jgi:hypothetical protein
MSGTSDQDLPPIKKQKLEDGEAVNIQEEAWEEEEDIKEAVAAPSDLYLDTVSLPILHTVYEPIFPSF